MALKVLNDLLMSVNSLSPDIVVSTLLELMISLNVVHETGLLLKT